MAVRITAIRLIVLLTAWVLSALPAHSQIDSINTRLPTINRICEAIGVPCNTGLTISGCPEVCVTTLDTELVSRTESGFACQVDGTVSTVGDCDSCQSSTGTRRLDFDSTGTCSRQYLELFLQETTPEFISGLATLSEAQCADDTDGNVFSQMFMGEAGRIFCVASGMAPSQAPTDAGTVTPSPSSSSPAFSTPSPSSSPNTSATVSASPSSSPEDSPTASITPDTVAISITPAVASTSPSHSIAPESSRERGRRRSRSFCSRQIRRCIRPRNSRGRFRRGQRNRIITRCCIRFCRCEWSTSRHCVLSCKTSLSRAL